MNIELTRCSTQYIRLAIEQVKLYHIPTKECDAYIVLSRLCTQVNTIDELVEVLQESYPDLLPYLTD